MRHNIARSYKEFDVDSAVGSVDLHTKGPDGTGS